MIDLTPLLLALTTWVSALTGLPQAMPPEIILADYEARCALVHEDPTTCARQESEVRAVYLPEEDGGPIIVLPHDFDLALLADVSLVAHELVHHLQYEAGQGHRCIAWLEREAYDVQRALIEAAGANFYETIELDPLFHLLITGSCERF